MYSISRAIDIYINTVPEILTLMTKQHILVFENQTYTATSTTKTARSGRRKWRLLGRSRSSRTCTWDRRGGSGAHWWWRNIVQTLLLVDILVERLVWGVLLWVRGRRCWNIPDRNACNLQCNGRNYINFAKKDEMLEMIPNQIVLVTWQKHELPPKIYIFTKCLIGLHDLGSAPPAIFSSWPSLEPTLVPETPSLLLIWLSLSGQITLLARQDDYHFQFPA